MGEQKKRVQQRWWNETRHEEKSTFRRCVIFCTTIYEECYSNTNDVEFYVFQPMTDYRYYYDVV